MLQARQQQGLAQKTVGIGATAARKIVVLRFLKRRIWRDLFIM